MKKSFSTGLILLMKATLVKSVNVFLGTKKDGRLQGKETITVVADVHCSMQPEVDWTS